MCTKAMTNLHFELIFLKKIKPKLVKSNLTKKMWSWIIKDMKYARKHPNEIPLITWNKMNKTHTRVEQTKKKYILFWGRV
jgi:hypothetical protein